MLNVGVQVPRNKRRYESTGTCGTRNTIVPLRCSRIVEKSWASPGEGSAWAPCVSHELSSKRKITRSICERSACCVETDSTVENLNASLVPEFTSSTNHCMWASYTCHRSCPCFFHRGRHKVKIQVDPKFSIHQAIFSSFQMP